MSAPARPATARALDDGLLAAAGLSLAAALIHVVAALDHAEEYALFAAFFSLLAPAQLWWGLEVCRAPSRRLLAAGALGSLAVVALWVMSRTTGLPIGPEPWQPEAIGLPDVAASADELAIAALVALRSGRAGALRVPLTAISLFLVALSCLALMGGGGHAHHHVH